MPKAVKFSDRNKTIRLSKSINEKYELFTINNYDKVTPDKIKNKIINGDIFDIINKLPEGFVDLCFIDPPYNLSKNFNKKNFKATSIDSYSDWLDSWLGKLVKILKPDASVYICSDWRSSTSVHLVASKYFRIQNRITWQREKGRGAKQNWKNCTEDIWFCTVSDKYKFNLDRVKIKRKVIAPYKVDGKPKDWNSTKEGNFRLTHPSNIWDDISVPFWSMAENTEHPTQKPEKLLAKIILAGSDKGDMVFDPFLGSGTTAVVAKKLGRSYAGIEIDHGYCCLAEKRLEIADEDNTIQGYKDGVFWERNSL